MQSEGSTGHAPISEDHATTQRAVLLQLDRLTGLETDALNRGDLAALAHFSEERARLVQRAAPSLPPAVPWAADLSELVDGVHGRSAALQDAVRDCMVEVRRELKQIAARARINDYDRSGDREREPAHARWQA